MLFISRWFYRLRIGRSGRCCYVLTQSRSPYIHTPPYRQSNHNTYRCGFRLWPLQIPSHPLLFRSFLLTSVSFRLIIFAVNIQPSFISSIIWTYLADTFGIWVPFTPTCEIESAFWWIGHIFFWCLSRVIASFLEYAITLWPLIENSFNSRCGSPNRALLFSENLPTGCRFLPMQNKSLRE